MLTVPLLGICAELSVGAEQRYPTKFLIVIAVVGLIAVPDAHLFRRRRLRPALEKLHQDPADPEALKRWEASTVLCLALLEVVALSGFALRFFGASRLISWCFYVLALILMLRWTPKLDLEDEAPKIGIDQ
jgi:hypothetical protein